MIFRFRMATYQTSDGQRVEKSVIDRRTREAKAKRLEWQRNEHGYNFCEDQSDGHICGHNGAGTYLDCSHEISVNECQKSKRTELAWDWQNNILIRCRMHHKNTTKIKPLNYANRHLFSITARKGRHVTGIGPSTKENIDHLGSDHPVQLHPVKRVYPYPEGPGPQHHQHLEAPQRETLHGI